MAGRWRKQRLPITNAAWTPVTAPMEADYVAFRCDTSAIVYRTDAADPLSEDTLPAGAQESVIGARTTSRTAASYWEHRFGDGEAICLVRSVEPTAILIVTWLD